MPNTRLAILFMRATVVPIILFTGVVINMIPALAGCDDAGLVFTFSRLPVVNLVGARSIVGSAIIRCIRFAGVSIGMISSGASFWNACMIFALARNPSGNERFAVNPVSAACFRGIRFAIVLIHVHVVDAF